MTKKILGVKIDDINLTDALDRVHKFLESKGSGFLIFTPGPEFLVTAQGDEEFKNVLNAADLSLPDGVGLQIFAGVKNKVPGVDFVSALCREAAKNYWTVGMMGGDNSPAAAEVLRRRYPELKISWALDRKTTDVLLGDYDRLSRDYDRVDILLVGLGHPKQEKFLYAIASKQKQSHIDMGSPRLARDDTKRPFRVGMGVGGSFDFISGKIWEPGKIWQTLGLKWLGRLVSRPGHFRRVFRAIVVFPLLLVNEKF